MLKDAKSRKDVVEIEDQFRKDMRDDLLMLKHELGLASLEPLFSKEIMLTVIALAGTLVDPISGITNLAATLQGVGIIPLVKTRLKHKKERRKALADHKMSWLYVTKEKPITLR